MKSIGSAFCDEVSRGELVALFTPLAAQIDGGPYAVAQAVDQVERCIGTQAPIRSSALQFFARY